MTVSQFGRVARAFVTALRMTLRGETAESLLTQRYPRLTAWTAQTGLLIDGIEAAAKTSALDLAALTVRLDKREMSAKTLLDGIRFHAAQEYPFMLRNPNPHAPLGIQSINLNDRYLALKLLELATLPTPVRTAAAALRDHIDTLPLEDFAPPKT